MPHRIKYFFESLEIALVFSLLGKGFYWVFVFLSPVHHTMAALTFLIVVDFITGLFALRKSRAPFEMNKLFWAASKFFLYNLMVISGFVMEMLVPGIPFSQIMAGFIGMFEFKSIGRNFNLIYGMDVFRALKLWLANRNRDWADIRHDLRDQYHEPTAPPPSDSQDEEPPQG